jgi:hypothetical protein
LASTTGAQSPSTFLDFHGIFKPVGPIEVAADHPLAFPLAFAGFRSLSIRPHAFFSAFNRKEIN